jgi:hypothetical protein
LAFHATTAAASNGPFLLDCFVAGLVAPARHVADRQARHGRRLASSRIRFCAWRSRRFGRPPLEGEIVALIERMAGENPLWSRGRIASELVKRGHNADKDMVAK